MLLAGFSEAARTALSSATPMSSTARFMQSYRQVALPAMTPGCSVRVARGPLTVTAWPPRLYSPSGRPQAIMLSAMRITRSSPKVLKVNRTMAGWMCTPSVMSSTSAFFSRAAMMGPGSRWVMPGMAL